MSANNTQKKKKADVLQMMPKEIIKDFWPLLKVQSTSRNEHEMVGYIVKRLMSIGLTPSFDRHGNILVTKGSAEYYPCIVAHMDTVHAIHDDYHIKIMQKGGRESVFAYSNGKMVGTGGDDKCGVYAVMYMLERIKNIKAVFFTQEESGLIGSGSIDHAFFSNVGHIIQLDRWGRGDFIDVYGGEPTVSTEYKYIAEPVLKRYGYDSTEGLITDSINLWSSDVGVSCVNVSCGYYQHHTDKEFIDLNELYNSLLLTYDLIVALGTSRYESKGTPMGYGSYNQKWSSYSYRDDYDYSYLTGTTSAVKIRVDEDLFFASADYIGIDIFTDDTPWEAVREIMMEYNSRCAINKMVTFLEISDYIDDLRDEWTKDIEEEAMYR